MPVVIVDDDQAVRSRLTMQLEVGFVTADSIDDLRARLNGTPVVAVLRPVDLVGDGPRRRRTAGRRAPGGRCAADRGRAHDGPVPPVAAGGHQGRAGRAGRHGQPVRVGPPDRGWPVRRPVPRRLHHRGRQRVRPGAHRLLHQGRRRQVGAGHQPRRRRARQAIEQAGGARRRRPPVRRHLRDAQAGPAPHGGRRRRLARPPRRQPAAEPALARPIGPVHPGGPARAPVRRPDHRGEMVQIVDLLRRLRDTSSSTRRRTSTTSCWR